MQQVVCKGAVCKVLDRDYWGDQPLLVVGRYDHLFKGTNICTQTFFLDPLRLADQVQPGVDGTAAMAFTLDEDGKLRPCTITDGAAGRHKGWTVVELPDGRKTCLVVLQAALPMGIFPLHIKELSDSSGDGLYVTQGGVYSTGGPAECREVPQIVWGHALDNEGLRTLSTPPFTADAQATALMAAVVLKDCPTASTGHVKRMVRATYTTLTGIKLSRSAVGTAATAIQCMVKAVLARRGPA